ncbi:MAG: hypothetical protein RBU30_02950 [Polyangia bacterium]|jgi:hypothetical protein|nr:hypothetical protein [Polyangia bacterium]
MTDLVRTVASIATRSLSPALPPSLNALEGGAQGRHASPAEAREVAALVGQLAGAPARSETERFGAACLCRALPRGNGSREAFLKLAAMPEFWSRLDSAERGVVAKALGGARSSAETARLQKAYAQILPDPLFLHARSAGKRNALSEPFRASALVHDMSYASHRLSGDPAQMVSQARDYATWEWNTEKGRQILTENLYEVGREVLTRAFEDRSVLLHYKGQSQWIGERFTSFAGRKSFASAAHKYMNARIAEDHCGLFNGDRSVCVK